MVALGRRRRAVGVVSTTWTSDVTVKVQLPVSWPVQLAGAENRSGISRSESDTVTTALPGTRNAHDVSAAQPAEADPDLIVIGC